MSPMIESAREVMLVYARKNRAEMQRVLDLVGLMYASHCVCISCIHV